MKAPAPVRCPRCSYLPASATVICLLCGHDRRKTDLKPQCPYTRRTCNCGLKAHCITEIA